MLSTKIKKKIVGTKIQKFRILRCSFKLKAPEDTNWNCFILWKLPKFAVFKHKIKMHF